MTSAPSNAFAALASKLREPIDQALDDYTTEDSGYPEILAEAMRHSLLAPGKRLRPVLVLMAAEACGCDPKAAIPAACAVEMVHTYSLIHDDLPAMDDDDMRRGQPSCHKKFGEAMAILAGDALLAMAFEVIARDIQPPQTAAACCQALAHAAGCSQLVGGQVDDLLGEFARGDLDQLESIHRRKTGALFRVSLKLGGLVAGANNEQLAALDTYGNKIGLAFQIMDDVLDLQGDATSMGKHVGKDSAQGKMTFPSVLGIDESLRRAGGLIDDACGTLAAFPDRAAGLEALARFVMQRTR